MSAARGEHVVPPSTSAPPSKPEIDLPSRYHAKFAETAIRQMEEGTAPWQRSWSTFDKPVLPWNPATHRAYTAGNALYLAVRGQDRGFTDNRWLTAQQIREAGGQPPKGPGERILVRQHRNGHKPVCRTSTVYNVEQVRGLKLERRAGRPYWEGHNLGDAVIAASAVGIKHSDGTLAYYSKDHDQVVLPHWSQFRSVEHHYATAFRHMAHASGHESRMDRESFRQQYEGRGGLAHARETLRTEIAAMTLGDSLGIGYAPDHESKNKELWIKALKEDPREMHRAASEGYRIAEKLIAPAIRQLQEIRRETSAAMTASKERDPHEVLNPREYGQRPVPMPQQPVMVPGR